MRNKRLLDELVCVIQSLGPDILPVLSFTVYPAIRTKLSDTSMTIAFLATPAHHDLTLLQGPTQELSVPETHWRHSLTSRNQHNYPCSIMFMFAVCNSKALATICGGDCQLPPQISTIIKTLIISWAYCHSAKRRKRKKKTFLSPSYS